jgi:hypothetical protein
VTTNRGWTAERIRQELSDMTRVALAHEDAWSSLEKNVQTAEKAAAKPGSPRSAGSSSNQPAAAKLSLVGTWSAALDSGEAFAIQINRDATFKLVHFKSGQSVSSLGTASRSGGQLTLNGNDGTKIVGKVRQATADAFQLTISGTELSFKKAK